MKHAKVRTIALDYLGIKNSKIKYQLSLEQLHNLCRLPKENHNEIGLSFLLCCNDSLDSFKLYLTVPNCGLIIFLIQLIYSA